jgi:hypothetical protein
MKKGSMNLTIEELENLKKREKLFEQIFNKTHRLYYHISDKLFDKFSLSYNYNNQSQKYGAIFLSPKIEFAIDFYNQVWKKTKRFGFLYTCKLIKRLDLFNPDSEKDFELLEKNLSEDELDKIIDVMVSESYREFNMIEDERIITIAGDNGYDGVNTYGYSPDESFRPAENIAVFDEKNIKLCKREKVQLLNNGECISLGEIPTVLI